MIGGLARALLAPLLLVACGAPRTGETAAVDSVPACASVPGEGAARSTPAFIEFTADLERADLEWLCVEGLAIVEVFPETRSVNVRIPAGYRGDPTRNPRVRRMETRMRGGS